MKMITTLKVYDLVPKRALITRESAWPIREALTTKEGDEIALDFAGIEAVTPSFIDELLGALDESFLSSRRAQFRLLLIDPPTGLSEKFLAIARARGLRISEAESGAWTVTSATAA
jgi:hypothetical protein